MQRTSEWQFNLAIKLFILIAIISLMVAGQTFFIPFILAVFLSFLLYPISRTLERIRVPKALAIIVSILVGLIAIGALIWFFVEQLTSFQEDIPILKKQLGEKSNRLLNWVSSTTNVESSRIKGWVITKVKESDTAGASVVIGIF